jgi:hypothetical protein
MGSGEEGPISAVRRGNAMLIQPTAVPTSGSNGSSGSSVVGAIRNAAAATGTSFQYLLATAQVESGLNPKASASGSSARGLYQFIDQTWLTTLKESGASLGYGRYADAITRSSSGRYQVADADTRREIMALRNDPTANAAMAGAFTQKNAAKLATRIGRDASDGELYMAHFLGAAGAGRLITQASNAPQASAADSFPSAARANRSIFYDRQGHARTNAEVYGELNGRYQTALNSPKVRPAIGVADTGAISSTQRITAARAAVMDATQAGAAVRGATSAGNAVAPSVNTGFVSLFSDTRGQPVSQVVQNLWTTRPTVAAALTGQASAIAPAAQSGTPLDLFSDSKPDSRRLFGVGS